MENRNTLSRNDVFQWIRNLRNVLENHLSMIIKGIEIDKKIEEMGESEEINYWSINMVLERPFNELDKALTGMKDIVAYLTNNDEPRLTEYFVYRRGACIRIQDHLSKETLSITDKKYYRLVDSLLEEIDSVDMFLTEIAHPEIKEEREKRFLEELERENMAKMKNAKNAPENEDPEALIKKTMWIYKAWKAVESRERTKDGRKMEHIFEGIELTQYLDMIRTADFSAIKNKQVNPVIYTMYRISLTMKENWLKQAVEQWNEANKDMINTGKRQSIDYKEARKYSHFNAKKYVFQNESDKENK